MYRIKVAQEAEKFIRRLDKPIQRRIINAIRSLAQNPRPQSCKKLKGLKELCRIRSGDYRIAYSIKEKILLVLVVRVAHRKDIYRHIKK